MKIITLTDGINQFTFNDNADGTILREFEGFEYPNTRPVLIDLPARDGSLYIGSQFGSRRLSWSGDVVNPNIFARRRSMLSSMSQGQLKLLQFTTYDDLELQTYVEIKKVVMPYTHMVHGYLIEAVAPDYRFYTQELTTETVQITEQSGGMAIPTPIPGPIGGGASIPVVVDNVGNANTFPILTITGPGTNFTIQNLDTGQSMAITIELNAGETIVINTLNRTLFKGNQNVFGSFSGDWLWLQPGNNRFFFNAQLATDENTQLEIQFRSAYLGI